MTRSGEPASATRWKLAGVAFGIPAATWCGIGAYWSFLRWTGEVPLYYQAAMTGLRGILHAPLQLVIVGILALLLRKELARIPWLPLALCCAVAAPLAAFGDAIGMHYSRCEDLAAAERWWQIAPHAIGPAILLLTACLAPRAKAPPPQ